MAPGKLQTNHSVQAVIDKLVAQGVISESAEYVVCVGESWASSENMRDHMPALVPVINKARQEGNAGKAKVYDNQHSLIHTSETLKEASHTELQTMVANMMLFVRDLEREHGPRSRKVEIPDWFPCFDIPTKVVQQKQALNKPVPTHEEYRAAKYRGRMQLLNEHELYLVIQAMLDLYRGDPDKLKKLERETTSYLDKQCPSLLLPTVMRSYFGAYEMAARRGPQELAESPTASSDEGAAPSCSSSGPSSDSEELMPGDNQDRVPKRRRQGGDWEPGDPPTMGLDPAAAVDGVDAAFPFVLEPEGMEAERMESELTDEEDEEEEDEDESSDQEDDMDRDDDGNDGDGPSAGGARGASGAGQSEGPSDDDNRGSGSGAGSSLTEGPNPAVEAGPAWGWGLRRGVAGLPEAVGVQAPVGDVGEAFSQLAIVDSPQQPAAVAADERGALSLDSEAADGADGCQESQVRAHPEGFWVVTDPNRAESDTVLDTSTAEPPQLTTSGDTDAQLAPAAAADFANAQSSLLPVADWDEILTAARQQGHLPVNQDASSTGDNLDGVDRRILDSGTRSKGRQEAETDLVESRIEAEGKKQSVMRRFMQKLMKRNEPDCAKKLQMERLKRDVKDESEQEEARVEQRKTKRPAQVLEHTHTLAVEEEQRKAAGISSPEIVAVNGPYTGERQGNEGAGDQPGLPPGLPATPTLTPAPTARASLMEPAVETYIPPPAAGTMSLHDGNSAPLRHTGDGKQICTTEISKDVESGMITIAAAKARLLAACWPEREEHPHAATGQHSGWDSLLRVNPTPLADARALKERQENSLKERQLIIEQVRQIAPHMRGSGSWDSQRLKKLKVTLDEAAGRLKEEKRQFCAVNWVELLLLLQRIESIRLYGGLEYQTPQPGSRGFSPSRSKDLPVQPLDEPSPLLISMAELDGRSAEKTRTSLSAARYKGVEDIIKSTQTPDPLLNKLMNQLLRGDGPQQLQVVSAEHYRWLEALRAQLGFVGEKWIIKSLTTVDITDVRWRTKEGWNKRFLDLPGSKRSLLKRSSLLFWKSALRERFTGVRVAN